LAGVLEVSYQWLTTGRGEMMLPSHWHDVPAVDAERVENPFERRLLKAWRALPAKPCILFLELVEAYQGRKSR